VALVFFHIGRAGGRAKKGKKEKKSKKKSEASKKRFNDTEEGKQHQSTAGK
jgi:hypothetical protein